jgi:hypothetical protein
MLSKAIENIRIESAAAAALDSGGPTNQQIINAAKAAYASHKAPVDALALALARTVQDASRRESILALNRGDTTGPVTIAPFIAPFLDGSELAGVLGAAASAKDIKSCSVGIFSKKASKPAILGVGRDLDATETTGVLLDLDIFKQIASVNEAQNLQYALWLSPIKELAAQIFGLYVRAEVQGTDVNMKLLVTSSLSPHGLVVSTGTSLPVSSGLFAGTARTWTP